MKAKRINSIQFRIKSSFKNHFSIHKTSWYHRDQRALLCALSKQRPSEVRYWNEDYWFFASSIPLVSLYLLVDDNNHISSLISMHCDAIHPSPFSLLLLSSLFSFSDNGSVHFIEQWTHYILYIGQAIAIASLSIGEGEDIAPLDGITFFLLLWLQWKWMRERRAAWILTDRRHLNP